MNEAVAQGMWAYVAIGLGIALAITTVALMADKGMIGDSQVEREIGRLLDGLTPMGGNPFALLFVLAFAFWPAILFRIS